MSRLHLYLLMLNIALVLSNLNTIVYGGEISETYMIKELNRSSFPFDFIFGAATASYQVEGAWNEDGKGENIWDHYVHLYPDKIKNRSNGDIAADSYHLYKEDVKLLKEMNADAYRLSISWSRVLPRGKLSGGVNEKGIEYYNKLIDELLANGIKPLVTIFHWDVPQALDEEYGGFLSPKIINDYLDYANLCFERFGDRVKFWATFNEPMTFSANGYDTGNLAPFRCSKQNCIGGNSGTEPYLVAHNILLAHAEAVKSYRSKYQAIQKGKLGIVLNAGWFIALTNTSEDRRAANRQLDFQFGWYMNPLTSGDYPSTMRRLVGDRLPIFTKEQSESLKGSIDFLGLNYYTSNYAAHNDSPPSSTSYSTDPHNTISNDRDGVLIGAPTASAWLHVYPRGIYELLQRVKRKYNDPVIYITENGISEVNNSTLSLNEALQDGHRVQYYHGHLAFIRKAIEHGVKVKGFFAWALLDNFEWDSGYTVRFGIHYVDYSNKCIRYPKISAKWFKNFLEKKSASQI